MFGTGQHSISLNDILSKVSEADILGYYLNISEIPTVINSPLRTDKKPSFGINSPDGKKVNWIDLATNEKGGTFDLLSKMWNLPFSQVLNKVYEDLIKFKSIVVSSKTPHITVHKEYSDSTKLEVKIRPWKDYDLEYWKSFGISLEWLKYAEVYPVSHKIITKGDKQYVFGADKYAYAYIEHKEGHTTIKLYQPFNKYGYKWCNKHDGSVISLWTKIPQTGSKLCICSSLKDALCLWSNTGIPCINPQGEGYTLSNTAINELKKRFDKIYILYDNDEAGIKDSTLLAEYTGFTNIILPKINGCKDISDIFKSLNNKEEFINIISNLFK